jgi:hypothetical protein
MIIQAAFSLLSIEVYATILKFFSSWKDRSRGAVRQWLKLKYKIKGPGPGDSLRIRRLGGRFLKKREIWIPLHRAFEKRILFRWLIRLRGSVTEFEVINTPKMKEWILSPSELNSSLRQIQGGIQLPREGSHQQVKLLTREQKMEILDLGRRSARTGLMGLRASLSPFSVGVIHQGTQSILVLLKRDPSETELDLKQRVELNRKLANHNLASLLLR